MMKSMGMDFKTPGMNQMVTEAQESMFKEMQEEGKKAAEKKWKSYKDNKEQKDAAAFAVIDADKSGALDKHEVISALIPDTPANNQLMLALGLLTDEEMKMKN